MIDLQTLEVWFVTGSQHLYGSEVLKKVASHSQAIVAELQRDSNVPVKILCKEVVTTPEEISKVCAEANASAQCVGVVAWMHTFSPAKMWIGGLRVLHKPLLHWHTQFNRDLPWDTIDMDFMNLNQSAHGDREFGFMVTRMSRRRKVLVGHWQDAQTVAEIGSWTRVAAAWHTMQGAKLVRFGDNMRQVAVTEGDKVEAELVFGYSVNTHGIGDLVKTVNGITDVMIDRLVDEYRQTYSIGDYESNKETIREAARIELGLQQFLQENNCVGFTDTFEDLHGLAQLPGLAVQRLMHAGYGFAGEGDWKTAALVSTMKVMSAGLPGGNSFMEDYTYHMDPAGMLVLGAHMLEICPSITDQQPSLQVHPLGIGGKSDPARLVFDGRAGAAINVSVVDMGDRFRMVVNEVDAVAPPSGLPKLPVARVCWSPRPDLKTSAHAWILAGGAHHTCFSQNITAAMMEDFAEMAGIEFLLIGSDFNLPRFRSELKWNEVYYKFR